jgi:hypothetical protein
MLDKLKHLDLDRIDVDEAVALATFGDQLIAGYTGRSLEVPQWLVDNTRELNREIKNRHKDNLEKALRETELQLDALKSRDEKREDLKAKADRLKAALSA